MTHAAYAPVIGYRMNLISVNVDHVNRSCAPARSDSGAELETTRSGKEIRRR